MFLDRNTRRNEVRVHNAFMVSKYALGLKGKDIRVVHEHGHWWVKAGGRTFDVVAASGPGTIDGMDFEEV